MATPCFGLTIRPDLSKVNSPSSIYKGKYPSTKLAGGVVTLLPAASTNSAKPSALVACFKL